MTAHPAENDLALLAGGECGTFSRLRMKHHLRGCAACEHRFQEFIRLRSKLAAQELPDLDWDRLAAEMKANIRLGLEAGACVRERQSGTTWNPRLVFALASLIALIGAGFLMRPLQTQERMVLPVLESSGSGIKLRNGDSSLMLLNRHGAVAAQTVSAQGEIRARYIDGEAGTVTINNVYLE